MARGGPGRDGPGYAAAYAERFSAIAREGGSVHGEADFLAALRPPPARVLDAGCGTGRVAVRLAELGYDVAGVDADADMLAVARAEAPALAWDTSTWPTPQRWDAPWTPPGWVPASTWSSSPATSSPWPTRARWVRWPRRAATRWCRAGSWSPGSASTTSTCPRAAR